jgi:hypothetical protein
MRIEWPPLAVRSWPGALDSRMPPDEYYDRDHDYVQEAAESRPLHELRGLVVGQVAEIEGLLLYIASTIRSQWAGPLPSRKKWRSAGGALHDLRRLLSSLALQDELAVELETIWKTIQRRNRLVHGRIHIGFSRVGEHAPLESVIYLLLENDEAEDTPQNRDSDTGEEQDEDIECGEHELQKYLGQAHQALEAALDIWVKVSELLPNP